MKDTSLKGLLKFIKKFIFNDTLEINVEIVRTILSDKTLKLKFEVDHSKVWENSKDYSDKYVKELEKTQSIDIKDELISSSKYFDLHDLNYDICYEHKNLDVYDSLIDILREEDLEFSIRVTEYEPWFGIKLEDYYVFDSTNLRDAGFNTKHIILIK